MKHRVTVVALGALVVLSCAAYFARDFIASGPNAVAGVKGEARPDTGKAEGKADATKSATAGAPTPVEVVTVQPSVVKEDLQAVGSLRSNESVILRPEVSGR